MAVDGHAEPSTLVTAWNLTTDILYFGCYRPCLNAQPLAWCLVVPITNEGVLLFRTKRIQQCPSNVPECLGHKGNAGSRSHKTQINRLLISNQIAVKSIRLAVKSTPSPPLGQPRGSPGLYGVESQKAEEWIVRCFRLFGTWRWPMPGDHRHCGSFSGKFDHVDDNNKYQY